MLSTQTFSYLWRIWVDLFSGWGLPWDPQATAYFGLIFVFYVVGLVFKILVTPGGK